MDGNWEGSKATWCLSVSDCGGDGPASWGNDPGRNAVDNWLVSPALSLEAGTEYVLKFDYYTAYYVDENLEVYLSRSPEPGAEHTLLDKSVLRNYYGGKKNVSIPAQAEAGDYYISFRNAGTGGLMIMVKNVDVDVVSEAVFTDVHHVEQFTDVQVSVGADSRPEDAVGAVVTLKSSDREYAAAVGEDARASFTQIWKDVYTLSVAQPGFEFQPVEANLDAQTDYSVALKQILAPVTNIDAVVDEKGDVTVKWGLFADIADDFDGPEYADFEINPAGRHRWSYIDGDAHATYGFGSSTFPGMRSPMAALVFNYKSVDPELNFRTSRSGDRALGFFCPGPEEIDGGMKLNTSDYYLISPELAFHKPFTLRLYAMTYENQDGRLERIRAGYSLSGKSPEDFVWDEKGLQEVPEREWTEFSWNFPAEARYVALNSSSDDVFLLLVDDLSIGTGILHSGQERARGSFNGYTFSLDGAPAVSLAETSRKISDLTPGEHTAAVCKVYNGGTSAPLEVTFSTTDGLGSVSADRSGLSVRLDPDNVLRISGEFDSAAVWTPAGASVRHINAAATDLSDLAAGVYIVSAQGPSGRATARVIIK